VLAYDEWCGPGAWPAPVGNTAVDHAAPLRKETLPGWSSASKSCQPERAVTCCAMPKIAILYIGKSKSLRKPGVRSYFRDSQRAEAHRISLMGAPDL